MEHSPRDTKPRDVLEFHPKDRAMIDLIDDTLAEVTPLRRPGEIGAVACKPSLLPELPPEAA